jgi:hypothetical protein
MRSFIHLTYYFAQTKDSEFTQFALEGFGENTFTLSLLASNNNGFEKVKR